MLLFVFELWLGFDWMPRLKILRKGLSYFGVFAKQDSFQVKPQQVLWFPSAAAQQARDCAIERCSMRIHIKHRDASCCERNVYDIFISLNTIFVFELWIGFDLVPRLKILRKGLSYFGFFEKQDSSQVKPQQAPGGVGLLAYRLCISLAALDHPSPGLAAVDDPIVVRFSWSAFDAPNHGHGPCCSPSAWRLHHLDNT